MEERKFENSLKELEMLVEELEKGNLSLDVGIEKYKKGMELVKFCNDELESAEKKISILTKDSNGDIQEKDFSAENK